MRDPIAATAARLTEIITERDWIVAEPALDSAVGWARSLQAMGAQRVFALAAADVPELAPEVPYAHLDLEPAGLLQSMHAGEAALDAVPEEVVARIDAWDPARAARVLRAVFSHGAPVAGRATFGARPPAWAHYDDKTVIDALWDAVGVPRSPSRVIPVEPGALATAHAELDRGAGTVWALDNREGWTGASLGNRWVHDEATLALAIQFVGPRADRVRVMPFLDGVPCSIHGIVFPDHVVVLRPCELVTLRDRAGGRFRYATASTWWDPPAARRDELRDLARRVGEHLRAEVGYRGTFTIDGVLTPDGFRPTELNPRFGAALRFVGAGTPEIPLYLLHLAVVEGVPGPWPAPELEAALVERADAHRSGAYRLWLEGGPIEPRDAYLVRTGHHWLDADPDAADVHASVRTLPSGPTLVVRLEPRVAVRGASVAPAVAAVVNELSVRWSLGLPTLEPAPAVPGVTALEQGFR